MKHLPNADLNAGPIPVQLPSATQISPTFNAYVHPGRSQKFRYHASIQLQALERVAGHEQIDASDMTTTVVADF
jgi:hypothetical protein